MIEARPEKGALAADRRVRLFLQLAVIVFWGPCSVLDLLLLWRDRGGAGDGAFVFWLLFRQSLVFLALWFTVSLTHGLFMGGARQPRRRRRRHRGPERAGLISPIRYNRGQ